MTMIPWSAGFPRPLLAADPEGSVPIKVVLVYPMDLLGSKEGGAETFIRGFIKHAPEDFDLEVVGVTSDRRARPPARPLRVPFGGRMVTFRPIIFVRNENRRGRIPVSLRFTLALLPPGLRSEGAVYVFNRIEPALAFRRNRNSAIGLLHTDIPRQCVPGKTEIIWARYPRTYCRLEQWAVRRLDAVFAASEWTIDRYRRVDPLHAERMAFLPSWVDRDVFGPRTEDRGRLKSRLRGTHPGLPADEPWVLFVGRLQVVKAPFRAVEGFRRFLQDRGRGVLIMIGEGNQKERLTASIRRSGLENRIFLLGDKGQEELALFYQAADVFLLTSYYEGMPCCVLEALASGTPVVTTDAGEVRKVVRQGYSGEVVDGDAPTIAAALSRVIDNPDSYALEACRSCVKDFTPRKVLAPVFETVRRLVRGIPPEIAAALTPPPPEV